MMMSPVLSTLMVIGASDWSSDPFCSGGSSGLLLMTETCVHDMKKINSKKTQSIIGVILSCKFPPRFVFLESFIAASFLKRVASCRSLASEGHQDAFDPLAAFGDEGVDF